MKTRRAIFWATLSLILAMNGLQQEGFMRYVIAGVMAFSLLMLSAQTRGKDESD